MSLAVRKIYPILPDPEAERGDCVLSSLADDLFPASFFVCLTVTTEIEDAILVGV
ncbi:MAG TPA: hypothetical protein VK582_04580 [Pyrinomonadaceae bacterium]|nr:hypothetical protein [Pyrinomonadaceae bacterium]